MPGTRSINRWINLPASGGADDRFRADQPLGAGLVQIACSNAAWAARENSIRTLWEHPGQGDIEGLLGFGANAGLGTRVDEFPWDADPSLTTSVGVWYAGKHRVRTYGELGSWPTITLSARLANGGGSTAGLVLVARALPGRPQAGDASASITTASATLTTVSCSILGPMYTVAVRHHAPLDERTAPSPPPAEEGDDTALHLWVGCYTTGAGKSNVRGMTLFLAAPP